jgi:hypothetical protein
MRLRAVRPFRWAGEHVEPGTLLDVADEHQARLLVFAYGDCVLVDGAGSLPAPSAMVIGNSDPMVEQRDPIATPKRGRR